MHQTRVPKLRLARGGASKGAAGVLQQGSLTHVGGLDFFNGGEDVRVGEQDFVQSVVACRLHHLIGL